MARAAALDYKSLFPEELPSFAPPPLDVRGAAIEILLRDFQRASEEYFAHRESMLLGFERSMRSIIEIAEKFSLSGGPPRLEELIALAGDHLEKIAAQLRPQIEDALRSKRSAASSKHPRARAVMTAFAQRNLNLMRRYLGVAEETYDELIALRDEAVRRSFEPLGAEVLASVWNDDDDR